MVNPGLETVWQRLAEAARARSPFNFLQLATLGLDGAPQLRTVVLRRCPAVGQLGFVTDARSPKVAEILREPRVSLVGYDPAANVQIRLTGTAGLVDDEIERRAVWQSLRGRTLALFDAPLPPGTILADDGSPLDRPAETTGPAIAYDRFALVSVTVDRLEWLDLAAMPHRRFAYLRNDAGWTQVRLVP